MNRERNNKSGSRNYRYEHLLYAVLWCIALAYPFFRVGETVLDGGSFRWESVLRSWADMLPFAVLLLIHAFILLPILFIKRHISGYILSTAVLVGLFFIYTDTRHPDRNPQRPMPPFLAAPHPHRLPPADSAFPPPPFDEERPVPKPDTPSKDIRIPGPVIIDTFIAILLLGCHLAIKLMFKHYEGTRRMEELEKTQIRQELVQLKAQISPHFFMNSLNNIHGMVEIDPSKAQDMILELSGMMRYVLYESTSAVIVLSKEIDFLCNYISLMRIRYTQDRVVIDYKFPGKEEAGAVYIPPLIFIIFIENAFKHGVNYQDDSFVSIDMSICGSELTFRCMNSCRQDGTKETLDGVGLSNIRKRLDILYADNYTLDIDEREKTFHVTLTIPTKNENQMYSNR